MKIYNRLESKGNNKIIKGIHGEKHPLGIYSPQYGCLGLTLDGMIKGLHLHYRFFFFFNSLQKNRVAYGATIVHSMRAQQHFLVLSQLLGDWICPSLIIQCTFI